MKIETVQKIYHRIRILNGMKDDYLFMRESVLECDKNAPEGIDSSCLLLFYDECINLLDVLIKFYSRKVNRS